MAFSSIACINVDDRSFPTQDSFSIIIPANIGDGLTKAIEPGSGGTTITSAFSTNDKIYLYKDNGSGEYTWIRDKNGNAGYLTPKENGPKSELVGTLKGTVSVGDKLILFYKNSRSVDDITRYYYSYSRQDGSVEKVCDYAIAEVTVTSWEGNDTDGYTLQTSAAHFESVQSIFRQKLTFLKDGNPVTPASLESLIVSSENNDIQESYYPFGTSTYYDQIAISSPVLDSENAFFLGIRFGGSVTADNLTITVQDTEGNVFACTKASPDGGFKNGIYYYGQMTLNWIKQNLKPTVTGTTVQPNAENRYQFFDRDAENNYIPSNFTISGTSSGYSFYLHVGGIVTLDNLTANRDDDEFILSAGDLTIDIMGDNQIKCSDYQCITTVGDAVVLKLKGDGTLTVTTKYDLYKGLKGANYDYNSNSDPSVLAVEGYQVTCSDRVDNSDGTFTWKYTVHPVTP